MLRRLYVLNATLLVVHEIHSAFWREWDLLALPGGEAGFLALHVPLVALVVWGHGRLVEGARGGAVVALLLAASGIGAAAVHAALLAGGAPEFRAPASVALLGAIVLASVALAPLAIAALRRPAAPSPRVAS